MGKIKVNQEVIVLRDISRAEGLYATQGEKGVVKELFKSGTGAGESRWNAKVLMDSGEVKTFRLSSITDDFKGL